MKAIWKNTVIAESGKTVEVEGNQYFPPDSVNMEHIQKSETTYTCPWKGFANYYDVVVDGEINKDAAWYYADPSEAAKEIAGHVAFGNGVEVTE